MLVFSYLFKRIFSSEKWFNYVVTCTFLFLKKPKIWVGRTTLNGEKKRMAKWIKKDLPETYSTVFWCLLVVLLFFFLFFLPGRSDGSKKLHDFPIKSNHLCWTSRHIWLSSSTCGHCYCAYQLICIWYWKHLYLHIHDGCKGGNDVLTSLLTFNWSPSHLQAPLGWTCSCNLSGAACMMIVMWLLSLAHVGSDCRGIKAEKRSASGRGWILQRAQVS